MSRITFSELPPGNLQDLMRAVQALYRQAGAPSMRRLADGLSITQDTVHRLLSKTTNDAPKWRNLEQIVRKLADEAPNIDVETEVLRFHELWMHADERPFSTNSDDKAAETRARRRGTRNSQAGNLPAIVRFTDLVTIPTPEELRATWHATPERSEVVVGRDGDGPFSLDIGRDGPHALIAGTSGAGTSALLQTWLGAMALANAPENLSIILLSYKSGATFRDLSALPHVVGVVQDFDRRLAMRVLSSMRVELSRRQHQLSNAGAADRAEYMRRAETSSNLSAFPRLLVVVDELAALKEQMPELVDGLIGLARTGRALGIHVVFATQRVSGVVDSQIRANTDLRICLRTHDESDSIDVVGVKDASYILVENPGRALVRHTAGHETISMQTAWITAPVYVENTVAGSVLSPTWAGEPVASNLFRGIFRTDLNNVIDVVMAAASFDVRAAPYRPWTPPLPPILLLDDQPAVPGHILIGCVDRLEHQRQEPLLVAFGAGHIGIFGSSRTGRTTALRALAAGVARANSPTAVHLHVIDGGIGLSGLTALPHAGVVVNVDDPTRLERLLIRLVDEIHRRRRLLAEQKVTDLLGLGHDAPPAIILLVDDWQGVIESDGTAQVALQEVLNKGIAVGVTVCIAGDERMFQHRVLSRIEHRLCLRLNNPSDALALGLDSRNLPDKLPPGRGLWVADDSEVQVPLLDLDQQSSVQAAALAALAAIVQSTYGDPVGDRAPLSADSLPARIGPEAAARLPELVPGEVLVGVGGDRLSAVRAPLSRTAGPLLVAGPPRTGRSTAVSAIAADAAAQGRTTLMVVPRPGAVHQAAIARGVKIVDPVGLPKMLETQNVDVLVFDDADLAIFSDVLVSRLFSEDGPALVVAAALDSFGFGARGLVKAVGRASGPVVLLCPPNHLAADNVGIRIERGTGFDGPAGRALLSVGGNVLLGQVPDLLAE